MTDQKIFLLTAELGQPVLFTAFLKRKTEYRDGYPTSKYRTRDTWKIWDRVPMQEGSQVEGIIIGTRTLVNGIRDYIGYEEGYQFIPKERVKVFLVAFDMRQNPVYVLPEDLRLLDE